jgi:hypothetical protein
MIRPTRCSQTSRPCPFRHIVMTYHAVWLAHCSAACEFSSAPSGKLCCSNESRICTETPLANCIRRSSWNVDLKTAFPAQPPRGADPVETTGLCGRGLLLLVVANTALVIASFKMHAQKSSSHGCMPSCMPKLLKLHGGATRKCRANICISVPDAARGGHTENC